MSNATESLIGGQQLKQIQTKNINTGSKRIKVQEINKYIVIEIFK